MEDSDEIKSKSKRICLKRSSVPKPEDKILPVVIDSAPDLITDMAERHPVIDRSPKNSSPGAEGEMNIDKPIAEPKDCATDDIITDNRFSNNGVNHEPDAWITTNVIDVRQIFVSSCLDKLLQKLFFTFQQSLFADKVQDVREPIILKVLVVFLANSTSIQNNLTVVILFQKFGVTPDNEYQLALSDLVRKTHYVLLQGDALAAFLPKRPKLPALLKIFKCHVETSQVLVENFEDRYS